MGAAAEPVYPERSIGQENNLRQVGTLFRAEALPRASKAAFPKIGEICYQGVKGQREQ